MDSSDDSHLARARDLDALDSPVAAAWAYELAIGHEPVDVEAFLDVAVIYIAAAEYGYQSAHALPEPYIRGTWEGLTRVLGVARDRFGHCDEISFWARFLQRSVLDEDDQFDDDCRLWLRRRESLVPSFYVYTCLREPSAEADARLLFEQVRAGRTTRDRFILSYLRSNLFGLSDLPCEDGDR